MKPKKIRINIPVLYILGFIYQLLKQGIFLFFAYGLVSLTGLFTVINHPWFIALVLLLVVRFFDDWLVSTGKVLEGLLIKQAGKEVQDIIKKNDEED